MVVTTVKNCIMKANISSEKNHSIALKQLKIIAPKKANMNMFNIIFGTSHSNKQIIKKHAQVNDNFTQKLILVVNKNKITIIEHNNARPTNTHWSFEVGKTSLK